MTSDRRAAAGRRVVRGSAQSNRQGSAIEAAGASTLFYVGFFVGSASDELYVFVGSCHTSPRSIVLRRHTERSAEKRRAPIARDGLQVVFAEEKP